MTEEHHAAVFQNGGIELPFCRGRVSVGTEDISLPLEIRSPGGEQSLCPLGNQGLSLLIDDIFGELDPARRQALLATLPADSQTFITTTHLHWLGETNLPLPVQTISAGAILQ